MLGQLHHCLATGQTYDPAKAFPHPRRHRRAGRGLTVGDIGGLYNAHWRDPAGAAAPVGAAAVVGRAGGDLPRAGRRRVVRAIAARLGRAPSTVSREVARNGGRRRLSGRWPPTGRRGAGRAAEATQAGPLAGAAGGGGGQAGAVLVTGADRRLAAAGSSRPTDRMRVSHETIYRSLFVQARGALRQRADPPPAHRAGDAPPAPAPGCRTAAGCGRTSLNISQRPAEAADRAVPGHWEGDLLFGRGMSPVATLVERSTRYRDAGRRCPTGTAPSWSPTPWPRAITTLPAAAAPVADLGPRPRDGRPRPVHRRHRRRGLLLRPEEPLAARQQREHQRPAAPVPAPARQLRATTPRTTSTTSPPSSTAGLDRPSA